MPRPVLVIELEPANRGDFLIVSPVRIRYSTILSLRDERHQFPSDHTSWNLRSSNLNNHRMIDLLNQLQDVSIEGVGIMEFLKYEKTSVWQFIATFIQPPLLRVLELIDILGQIIDEVTPCLIHAFPVFDAGAHLWRNTLQIMSEIYEIPLVFLSPQRSRAKPKAFLDYNPYKTDGLIQCIEKHTLRISEQIANCYRQISVPEPSQGKKILFATSARHWVSVPGHPEQRYDEQIFPLLPVLRQAGWKSFVAIDCPHSRLREIIPKLWKRIIECSTDLIWRSFYSYSLPKSWRASECQTYFVQVWYQLQEAPHFRQIFQYRYIPLFLILQNDLKLIFTQHMVQTAEAIARAYMIIEKESPDAVIVTQEADGIFERALVIQAGIRGIPTVGLQHGMIFDNHYHYMHKNIKTDPVNDLYGFIRPQITCVWGPAWKTNLTKVGYYPSKSVLVTGNWRYDQILKIAQGLYLDKLRRHFCGGIDKTIVLIVSSNQNAVEFVRQCLITLAKTPDRVPLVKIHPLDDPLPFKKVVKEMGYPQHILLREQLIEALIAADVVVSQPSTVISEAILLQKSIILANLWEMSGWEKYVESGTCYYAENIEELEAAILDSLVTGQIPDDMRQAQEIFVREHFFQLDGCSAQRVVDGLQKLYQR